MNPDELRNRTKKLSINIILFLRTLPKNLEGKIISNQIIRSTTSVGANYRAACLSRSNTEFYAKLCIVVEEADETVYWLEIIQEVFNLRMEVKELKTEAQELLKIFSSSRKTVRYKINNLKTNGLIRNNQMTK